MSLSVSKIVSLQQAALKFFVEENTESEIIRERKKTIGGLFSDSNYAWLSNGPQLQIVNTKTGSKIGAWTFGWVLKDSNTQVVCVDEIQRPHRRLPLLVVGINCVFNGGMICIFDFVTSKVIRAVHIRDKITNVHVVDSGCDIFTLPGPLRNFDGVIAVGTAGGDVFLVDICRQICDEASTTRGLNEIRDELSPCELLKITLRDLSRIEHHKEFAVRNSQHLALHLNGRIEVVLDKSTKHFTLQGPKGDDRIHVNKDEVRVSALYYCPQLGSLLVGYNFGALQLYNLMNLNLVYTSPVCDEHIPISHFTIQEPADDPRSVCYIWAVYSSDEEYSRSLPLAVMYAFCYHTKEYHEGYGFLYQDFSNAAVQYQMELGVPVGHNKRTARIRGGKCLKIKSITQGAGNREEPSHDSNEDFLTLSVFVWNVIFNNHETQTFVAVFDLNQWYKEQMPSVLNAQYCSTYMIQIYLNELINSATNRSIPVLYANIDKNSIQQFTGAQRLEEHFYPNSLTFGMTCLRENDIIFLRNYGVQKAILAQIESSGPLCLVEPADIYHEVIGLGLLPLFIDLPINTPVSTNQQREIILGAALENHLMGWLCKCASEWANGSFLSTGCSLDFLISWAFQRAIALKNNCDKFCVSLFDYSQVRLDNNTNVLLNSCTRQLKNLCSLYAYVINKLPTYISNRELVAEQFKSLEKVSVYFEVLQWLLNVGLLPECPITSYPRSDDLERISAPYPAEVLIEFYNHRRGLLKILNEEQFSSSESVLFIDSLIERECGGKTLQEQWRNDDGNGLYPPPSLQALLRTYLVDNVDLDYKHSVIVYVFLDLAMTLDQERYKPVITHLIKFPAVFKLSPSMIKITQAFWQLDHNDYNTAMGLLLDPLISPQDLKPWHHKVVLRSLTLQKQYNFSLLYIQVRKPVLKDDDDIFLLLSLYVANNMLDEAFYFQKHFTNHEEKNKFLWHLFTECKKNGKLRSLIYRSFSTNDENVFLKYLTDSNQPTAEELKIYYHLLRSHFMEVFESQRRTVPNQIENQGLFGQENAHSIDKLVHSLKKLLPDVNRNLLNYCQKEKPNSWQQVSRPTPMSVVVHNSTNSVQYKSTLIGAALFKAKQTFNQNVNKRMRTDEMPFLRTPTVAAHAKRPSTVVITPKIVNVDEDSAPFSPPSAKRLKLSPKITALPSKLDTPLIKRKTPKTSAVVDKATTPHSILKVKNLIERTPTTSGQFADDFKEFKKLEYTPVTSPPKKSGLGLSPRKSLVRFEGLQSSSSSSFNNSRSLTDSTDKLIASPDKSSTLVSTSLRLSDTSKNSVEDDVFYSPDNSLEETEPQEKNEDDDEAEPKENISEEKSPSPVFSPKSRRSYKRDLDQLTPVRSSPRLSRNSIVEDKVEIVESPVKEIVEETKSEEVEAVVASASDISPILPKLRPRKSLCRKVLETNTLNRVLSSPLDSPRNKRRSRNIETSQITQVEESTEKIDLKYDDGQEIYKSSSVKKHSLSTSLVETDSDVSGDSSIAECDSSFKLPLSDSMLKYINTSNNSVVSNKSSLEEYSPPDNYSKVATDDIGAKEENKRDETVRSESFVAQDGLDKSLLSQINASKLKDDTLVSSAQSSVYSVLDSSAEYLCTSYESTGLKFSESMERCINNRHLDEENVDESEKIEDEEEVMEVDDDGVEEIAVHLDDPEKNEVLVYETLKSSDINGKEKNELDEPVDKENETFDGETSSNRPVDPEMNVFEISDDLTYNNDGLFIEKEVELEEDDLYYDQQNTLESVLEENISVSSAPVKVLEENVFHASSGSDDSYDVDDEEPRVEDEEQQRRSEPKEASEDEVIEIGSSSEDGKTSSESSKSSSKYSEDDEKHGRNIYDEDDDYYSETSRHERDHYSEISENSDDEEECGLFQGDIIAVNEESSNNAESSDGDVQIDAEGTDKKEDREDSAETKVRNDKNNLEDVKEMKDHEESSDDDVEVDDGGTERKEDGGEIAETKDEINPEDVKKMSDQKDEKNEEDFVQKVHVEVTPEEDVSVDMEELQLPLESSEDNIKSNVSQKGENVVEENVGNDPKDESPKEELGKEKEATETEKLDGTNVEHQDAVAETEIKEQLPVESVEEPRTRSSSVSSSTSKKSNTGKKVPKSKRRTRRTVEDVPPKEELVKDEMEASANLTLQDPLDIIDTPGAKIRFIEAEADVLELLTPSPEHVAKKLFARTSSVSSSSKNDSNLVQPKRLTRSSVDILDKLGMETPKPEPDILGDLLKTQRPVRTLRTRRISVEEPSTPTPSVRKRSASVDESKMSREPPVPTRQDSGGEPKKKRSKRAVSVSNLPEIPEEGEDGVKQKKAKSVLEGYSLNRRLTRQQVAVLKKVEDFEKNLGAMDPIVLLDKLPFEGKPDPEEQKVYETSPTTSTSSTVSPIKVARRLRSASQTSERSERSKSTTPTKQKKSEETSIQPRVTRSRAKSVSSVTSDDSSVSDSVKADRRRPKISSTSRLPEIEEEPGKSTVAKRRTRKSSSQL